MVTSAQPLRGIVSRYLRAFLERRALSQPGVARQLGARTAAAPEAIRTCPTSPQCSAHAARRARRRRATARRLPAHAAGRRAAARARLRAACCASCASRALPEESRRAVRSERVHASERALAVVPKAALTRRARAHRIRAAVRQVTVSHRHLRSPRADLRLRLRPRRPARLHGPLHARLPARARQPVGVGAAARFQLQRALGEGVRRARRSPRSTGRAGSSRRSAVGRRGRNRSRGRLRLHDRGPRRHARGADHLQRAGDARRPRQGSSARPAGSGARPRRRSSGCG